MSSDYNFSFVGASVAKATDEGQEPSESKASDAPSAGADSEALLAEGCGKDGNEDGLCGEGTEGEDDIPAEACGYCGIHNPDTLVECNRCNKWFCNGRTGSASHIVSHLVRSRHKEVTLHPKSSLGASVLQCCSCKSSNVFTLGWLVAVDDDVVMLMCRACSQNPETERDTSSWSSIIADKVLVSWLVGTPSRDEWLRARRLATQDIIRLEEYWQSHPEGTLADLTSEAVTGELAPVSLRYQDAYAYKATFLALIAMEADHDRKLKESQSEIVQARFEFGLNKKRVAVFTLATSELEVRVVPGDELKLSTVGGEWNDKGTVVRLSSAEEVVLELASAKSPPAGETRFKLEFIFKSTPFMRMKTALSAFATDEASVAGVIYHRLLGHDVKTMALAAVLPDDLSAPGLPPLNESQVAAVRSALTAPLSLIQGPPGTGKTVTSATLVYHLVRSAPSSGHDQVLVTAPSNVAVDQLAEKIHATGLRVVRLTAFSRESVDTPVDFLTLHYQVNHLQTPNKSQLAKLAALKERVGSLSQGDEKKLRSLTLAAEREVLDAADVICCTCIGAGDPRLMRRRFQRVLIDEVSQATEPECLVPIVKGARQVILVGDQHQLGPVIKSAPASNAGLSVSLFQRLVCLGHRPVRLQTQYRMHPSISAFPSNTFYEGTLLNSYQPAENALASAAEFPWVDAKRPTFFLHTASREELSASGSSYLNTTEAQAVEEIVTSLFRTGVSPGQVGVITAYAGQRAYLLSYLQRNGELRPELYADVEVASVDEFQGREKDYIVLSCVRSNQYQGIGFLSNPRRLNVALTRAKHGLIIVGNAKTLARDQLWHDLISHYKDNELLVEGALYNLRLASFRLPRPRKAKRSTAFTFDTASAEAGSESEERSVRGADGSTPRPGQATQHSSATAVFSALLAPTDFASSGSGQSGSGVSAPPPSLFPELAAPARAAELPGAGVSLGPNVGASGPFGSGVFAPPPGTPWASSDGAGLSPYANSGPSLHYYNNPYISTGMGEYGGGGGGSAFAVSNPYMAAFDPLGSNGGASPAAAAHQAQMQAMQMQAMQMQAQQRQQYLLAQQAQAAAAAGGGVQGP
ncbi:DNA-binding protein SMUBP-2 [Thecamonas trahens ATCC 50062]|uniref:DNA-binding protein SMUBP-2 n=1 Tax=Thecamonas trahens ATCC 50062 TaxID=461836 RepID=A0A0L0DKP0_THETB|nr:DNA-binding protein SMUBP-2 [Thecamonas trahens ATCC 50062]KNC52601.1 DNA-binding protein SMUBP-2 [Thecamonas trahens ATCC 50062]|eukprot:XP_013755160.1 DNA-binding protein SMUBP-2 [Thecamonas trahens ATCC 50062]